MNAELAKIDHKLIHVYVHNLKHEMETNVHISASTFNP